MFIISFPGWILTTHLLVGNLLPDLMIGLWVSCIFLYFIVYHVWLMRDLVFNQTFSLQIRIFQYNGGRSREIYHTKRMQRFCKFNIFHEPHFLLIDSRLGSLNIYCLCYTISFLLNKILKKTKLKNLYL